MLFGIENRYEHIEMIEQVFQPYSALELHGVVRSFTPLGEFLIERMTLGRHRVSQRLEEFSYKPLASATTHDCQAGDKWNGLICQFLSALAASGHCSPQSASHCHAEK